MALVLISFITFLIAGNVQIFHRKQDQFLKDCDDLIELKKLELKTRYRSRETAGADPKEFRILPQDTEGRVDTQRALKAEKVARKMLKPIIY